MKRMKQLAALSLALLLLPGCAGTPAGSTQSTSIETPAVSTPVEEITINAPTDGQGWYLWDENGTINMTGRGAQGQNAVVASAKVEASQAGLAVLQKGGNAIDAAVATAFALAVVEPNASGIGGGGFMLVHTAQGESVFLDFREIAPAAAAIEQYALDENGMVVTAEKSAGGKSVAIPGEVAGLWYAYEHFGSGKVEWAELIQPAIDLARGGYILTQTLQADISDTYNYMLTNEELGGLFLEDLFVPEVGTTMYNEAMAVTLEKLAADGRDAFYTGEIAQAMVDSVQEAGGFMTMEDLANYEVRVDEPVQGTYRGYQVLSSPLPSSGGTHVIEALNIMENFDLAGYGFGSTENLHLLTEIFGIVFKDRSLYMGDPNYIDVPESGLVSKEYAAAAAAQLTETSIADYSDVDPWQYEHEDTTHFSVADAEGNMVAVTQTINLAFGSKVVVKGCGFVFNDEMNDFSADPSSPNAIAPGKTPLSSMSPTVVLNEDGSPFMVLGSPGSMRIITTVTQVISNVIDHSMTLEEAIDAPRIYADTQGVLHYEDRFDAATIAALAEMGYEVGAVDPYYRSYGSVQAVHYDEDGTLVGGADPRRDGKALAY